jgi:hypothetical protein
MSQFSKLTALLFERGDQRVAEALFAAVSISPDKLRTRLRAQGLAYYDPASQTPPTLRELDHTAERLIKLSKDNATAMGGIVGAAGALSVPPEIAAHVVAIIRLGQRLAVVYGFDPESDRGKMALWRALAAAFETEFPERGPMDISLREVLSQQGSSESVSSVLGQAMVRRSTRLVNSRVYRLLPLVYSGGAALAARRRVFEAGRRMHTTYRQLIDLREAQVPDIEDAVEIDS